MKTMWQYVALAWCLVVFLAACAQPAARPTSTSASPVEKSGPAKPQEVPIKAAVESKVSPTPARDLPSTVAIGTHPTGGAYFAAGAGIAKVVSDFSPVKAIVKPSAGPNAWMPMLQSGELELGLLSAMDAGWAYFGKETFDKKPNKNLRLVMSGNELPAIGLAVRANSDIKRTADVRGKRVTSEFGGNLVFQLLTTASLESVGVTWNDVIRVPVPDINTAARALREGRADVSAGAAALSAFFLEVDAAIPVRHLDFGDIPPEQASNPPKEKVEGLQRLLPGVKIIREPKVGWLKSDATAMAYPIYLGAAAQVSADAVYEITKALYDNDKELHPIHDWLKGWKRETMFTPEQPAPYHEGAVRFWKEKGLWNSAAEERQKKLLSE